jgi:hypothetical protein
MSIAGLPTEIWTVILQQGCLSTRDFARFTGTCKAFRDIPCDEIDLEYPTASGVTPATWTCKRFYPWAQS